MKLSFADATLPKGGAVVVSIFEGRELSPSAAHLDAETDGALHRALKASRFTGKKDELLAVLAPGGIGLSRIVLVGLGKTDKVDGATLQSLGGTVVAHLNSVGEADAAILLDELATLPGGEAAANV